LTYAFKLIRQVKFIGKKRRIRQAQTELSKESLQLGVFGLGGDEDGDVRVGVLPQREENDMRRELWLWRPVVDKLCRIGGAPERCCESCFSALPPAVRC
jgi:hypothetical protein